MASEQSENAGSNLHDEHEDDDKTYISFEDIEYGLESFNAIAKPVLLTMILSSLAVTFISTPESKQSVQENLANAYTVFRIDDDDSHGLRLSKSLINGLVIVSVICALTFVLVLLYKYRCMKCLLTYMIIASTMLLGLLSASMFQIAIERYKLAVDKISFWLTIYNFSIVGTSAIFYSKAFPAYVTQGYLIATSVLVASQFSQFDEWTIWVLLVLLALYDLFAVLTPCGPLKALVNLMQREGASEMPGLLYEASVPGGAPQQRQTSRDDSSHGARGAERPRRVSRRDSQKRSSSSLTKQSRHSGCKHQTFDRVERPATTPQEHYNRTEGGDAAEEGHVEAVIAKQTESPLQTQTKKSVDRAEMVQPDETPYPTTTREKQSLSERDLKQSTAIQNSHRTSHQSTSDLPLRDDEAGVETILRTQVEQPAGGGETIVQTRVEVLTNIPPSLIRTGEIPLALAKLYKLPLVDNPRPSWIAQSDVSFTPEQLQSNVQVVFPHRGGCLVPHSRRRQNEPVRYQVVDRNGNIKRILFVNTDGRVFEDLTENNDEDDEEGKSRKNIKLGLGDFIFYSILVSKAAEFSFTAFSVCVLVVLVGLGLTLLLLAVRQKALPALPISIFFGVTFYVLTRFLLQHWVQEIFLHGSYV